MKKGAANDAAVSKGEWPEGHVGVGMRAATATVSTDGDAHRRGCEGFLRNRTKKVRRCKVRTALHVADRKRKLEMRKGDCTFCKIASGGILSAGTCKNEGCRAILDLNPVSKRYVLMLPKEHYNNITEMSGQATGEALSFVGKVGEAV